MRKHGNRQNDFANLGKGLEDLDVRLVSRNVCDRTPAIAAISHLPKKSQR